MRNVLGTATATLLLAAGCTGIEGLWDDPLDAGIAVGDANDTTDDTSNDDTSTAEPSPSESAPIPDNNDRDPVVKPKPDAGAVVPNPPDPVAPTPDDDVDAGTEPVDPVVEPPVPATRATVSVDTAQRFQTLVGFGAAAAWYGDSLTQHPHREIIYDTVFAELGLDILRLRNIYRREGGMFDPSAADIVAAAERSLGHPPKILLSSWSPPEDLKANGNTDCVSEATTCTLKKIDGVYPYTQFAAWWRESLDAYAEIGVVPDYVSIQNEPDFTPPSWEGCRFDPVEGAYPGYDQAMAAVRQALSDMPTKPQMVGPESVGLRYDKLHNYNAAMGDSNVDVLAHHLYDGDYWKNPDLFSPLLKEVSDFIDGRPLFQTEFSDRMSEDALQTAWLVHNALVEGNAAAYLYWELFWLDGQGLVTLEPYRAPSLWTTELGHIVQPEYYAMQHYAKYTDPGYVRVSATVSEKTLKVSAFQAPDESRLTVILLNTGDGQARVHMDGLGVPSYVYRTGAAESFARAELDDESELLLDSRGLATLVYE